MTEKTTVSETKYEINDMLDRYGLSGSFNKCIIKQGEKMGLMQGAEAENFIFSKLNELVKLVDDKRTDKTTDAELKTLISGWIEEQARIADQMHQVEESETQTFDQNDVKKLGFAYQILQAEKEIETQSEEDIKTRIADGYPVEAEDLNNLAVVYKEQGRYTEAEPLFKRGLEILEKSLGSEHPNTKIARKNLKILQEENAKKVKSYKKPKNINIATDTENKDEGKNPPQPVSGASGVNQ